MKGYIEINPAEAAWRIAQDLPTEFLSHNEKKWIPASRNCPVPSWGIWNERRYRVKKTLVESRCGSIDVFE